MKMELRSRKRKVETITKTSEDQGTNTAAAAAAANIVTPHSAAAGRHHLSRNARPLEALVPTNLAESRILPSEPSAPVVSVDESILALGIIGPITVPGRKTSLRSALMKTTLNENSVDYFQKGEWTLHQHADSTIALSYRYGKEQNLEEADASRAVELIQRHCRERKLGSVYIWCDNAYSMQRERNNMSWAAGGVAPYATFPVLFTIGGIPYERAGRYKRFWIWIETVLGSAGRDGVYACTPPIKTADIISTTSLTI
jgi:hypothetical protein